MSEQVEGPAGAAWRSEPADVGAPRSRPGARRWLDWLALLGWMAAIYVVSDQPDIPQAPGPWVDFAIKKLLHAAAYGVLAGLWWRALAGASPRRRLIGAFCLTLAYAALDEWHQTHVHGRTGRLRDIGVDAAGALVALAWLKRRGR